MKTVTQKTTKKCVGFNRKSLRISTAAITTALLMNGSIRAQQFTTPASLTIPDKLSTPIGTLNFKEGAPDAKTTEILYDNLDFLHAQTVFLNAYQGASTYAAGYPRPAAEANADGSTTVYIDPKLPAGVKDGNWIQSVPGKGYFVCLRLYRARLSHSSIKACA